MSWYEEWRPYVPVAKRRANAASYAKKLAAKEGRTLSPVAIAGRKIATSFWGLAWCDNLERYSDFANRLPRGRTYARNGSVVDLQIERGQVRAIVGGSEVYRVTIDIRTLAAKSWTCIKEDCAQSIASLIDLLQGRFEQGIMQRLTERTTGLFPQPAEIKMKCSCPDSARLCKHVAATLYGVGARLDTAPELLFTLRNVDHLELVAQAVSGENIDRTLTTQDSGLAGDLGEIFGIELDVPVTATAASPAPEKPTRRKRSAAPRASDIAVVESETSVDVKPRKTARKQPAAKETAGKKIARRPAAAAASKRQRTAR